MLNLIGEAVKDLINMKSKMPRNLKEYFLGVNRLDRINLIRGYFGAVYLTFVGISGSWSLGLFKW